MVGPFTTSDPEDIGAPWILLAIGVMVGAFFAAFLWIAAPADEPADTPPVWVPATSSPPVETEVTVDG